MLDRTRQAAPQNRRRDDRQVFQQFAAAISRKIFARFSVQQIELEKVMRQRVVIDRVLRVEPFAVKDVTVRQQFPQLLPMRRGPGLEERELALARAAVEKMSPALQVQPAIPAEADAGVRAVELFLDHDVFPL